MLRDAVTYVLHAIPASHPCAAVERALQLKGLPYRRVELIPVAHKAQMRARFGETTVPGLEFPDGRRLSGSRAILRALEDHPPSLVPADRRRGASSRRGVLMPQPNLNALLQQAQKMQQEMMEAQEKLKDERVEATAGGGMVKVVMTGDLELKELTIDPDAVDPEDVEMLQDMVMAAINEAMRQASDLQAKAAGGGVGGMDPAAALESLGGMGGLGGLLGGGGGGGRPGGRHAAQPRRAPQAEVAACSPRPSSAWSPSWASCPASATARRSGWRSTSCARARRTRTRWPTRSATSRRRSGSARSASTSPRARAAWSASTSAATPALICVVEEPGDVLPIERTHEFRGRYHVLGGALSPIDGVEPEDLKLAQLYARVERADPPVHEVVLATNTTTTGEATALHIADALRVRAPERHGHAARLRPPGRRRPRVRRRGHARPRVRRPPRALTRGGRARSSAGGP